jgi:hypothetical protein
MVSVKPLDRLTLADLWREVREEDTFWSDTAERQRALVKHLLERTLEEQMVLLLDAGHAHVVDALHGAAHELGGDGRLLGHRQVGGAGAEDGDAGYGRFLPPVQGDAAGGLVVGGVGEVLFEGGEDVGADPGHQEAAGAFRQPGGDGYHLLRRLALAQHHLWQVVAEGAVVVQLGEAQVLVGEETQVLQRVLYGRGTGGYRLQELAEPLRIDGSPSFGMPAWPIGR